MFIASLIESPFLDTRMWQKRKTQLANKERLSIGDSSWSVCRISLYTNWSAPPVLNARFKFYKRRQLSSARTMIFMMQAPNLENYNNSLWW